MLRSIPAGSLSCLLLEAEAGVDAFVAAPLVFTKCRLKCLGVHEEEEEEEGEGEGLIWLSDRNPPSGSNNRL